MSSEILILGITELFISNENKSIESVEKMTIFWFFLSD